MNLILEKTKAVRYFTNMGSVFKALKLSASSFDWYVSDVETNYYGDEFKSEDQWLSGVELGRFVATNDVQFIWAVFSAFPIGTRFEVTEPPIVEGNADYWSGREVKPQLSGALFEIAAWDSSATILIGLPGDAEENFKATYPEVKSLASAAR